MDQVTGLVGDIGGTNARFAVARVSAAGVALSDIETLPGHDYGGLEAAAAAYLAKIGRPALAAAVFACAGPVVDGRVTFTNVAWTVTEPAIAQAVGVARAHLINDLAAVAWAVPGLADQGVRRVARAGAPAPVAAASPPGPKTRAVLNAGTGCNASAWVENESGRAVLVGEFGHASFAPTDALEVEIWRFLSGEFGHVSNERLLAGPGLLNLYRALAAIEGQKPGCDSPAAVSEAAEAGDGLAGRATARFCAILGAVAGDVALNFGARGGVFLAGGVAATLLTASQDAVFRERFEAKGRFRFYLAAIPTLLIQDQHVALIGAGRAMLGLAGAPA